MALLPIVVAPDSRLKIRSKPVETVDDEVRRLLDDMLETMYAAPGIGLSAIQVNIPRRVVVVDVAREGETAQPIYMINPEIVQFGDEGAVYDEGCLSLPDHFAEIERPESVRVSYVDRDGKKQSLEAGGLLSRCIQHELDHLDGVLFTDHLTALKRNMILRKLAKSKRHKAAV